MSNARSIVRFGALVCGIAVAFAPAAHAQDQLNKYGNPMKHTPKPTTPAITAEELRTRLYIFSDDSMQGRRVAYIGNYKGTSYIASELKRLGIEPGGDNGTSYFQRLPYVTRKYNSTSTLSVNGSPLTFDADFVPTVPAMNGRAPRNIENAQVIYGGIEGDTTKEISPDEAAGKFVVMLPGTGGGGGGGGRGQIAAGGFVVSINGVGGANSALPAGCPAPAGGGRGAAGPGGGGRGGAGAGSGGVTAATAARFADAAGIAVVDLDALSPADRAALNIPTVAQSTGVGGRGAPVPADNVAKVPVPNARYQGTAGDMVVTNGNQIAVVRGGAVISGALPTGWTAATVKQKADSLARKSADSTARERERTDTLVATAKRLLAAGTRSGRAMFRGTAIPLDSTQIVTLACAPAGGGRGGAGGRGAAPAAGGGAPGTPGAATAAAARGGRGGGGRGGRGGGGNGAATTEPPAATFRITSAAATKLFGRSITSIEPGTGGSSVTAKLDLVEEPSDWARNVIGIVRGSDPKLAGEYVAIGAHNDHNGFNNRPVDHDSLKAFNDAQLRLEMQVVKGDLRAITPAQRAAIHVNMDSIRKIHPVPRLDSIQNGADDDGSGSMGVLEIAEAVAAMPVKPKRSIIFIWHTGEEAGLLGSNYFTANPTVPIDSIVTQINIDMIARGRAEDMVGGGPTYLGAVGSKRLSTDLNHEMLAVNAKEAKPLRIDYRFDDATLGTSVDGKPVSWPGYNNIYGRSDHANYANKCIPIVFFFTGLHGDYHQNTDEAQYVDYPHYSMITNYIRDLLVDVANRPVRPALDNVCTRR